MHIVCCFSNRTIRLEHAQNTDRAAASKLDAQPILTLQREQQQVGLGDAPSNTTERAASSRVGRWHLVLSSIFCHLPVALVLGQQHSLLLLVIAGGAGLAGGQGMQAQLGQATHEHMQLAPNPLLRLQQCSLGCAHMSAKQAGHWHGRYARVMECHCTWSCMSCRSSGSSHIMHHDMNGEH